MRGIGGLAVFLGACSGLFGCTGELDVFLADRSEPPTGGELEIDELFLPLDRVEALRDGAWIPLQRGPNPYNLLDFSSEATLIDLLALRDEPVRIAHDEIPAGTISGLRLVLTPGEQFEAETEDGVDHRLTVPTDAETGWQIDLPFEVEAGSVTIRTFAIRVRDSIVLEDDGTWGFVPVLEAEED